MIKNLISFLKNKFNWSKKAGEKSSASNASEGYYLPHINKKEFSDTFEFEQQEVNDSYFNWDKVSILWKDFGAELKKDDFLPMGNLGNIVPYTQDKITYVTTKGIRVDLPAKCPNASLIEMIDRLEQNS